MKHLFLHACLISLDLMTNSIHIVTSDRILSFFMVEQFSNMCVCVCTTFPLSCITVVNSQTCLSVLLKLPERSGSCLIRHFQTYDQGYSFSEQRTYDHGSTQNSILYLTITLLLAKIDF